MSAKARGLLLLAVALVVAGILALALQPGEPEAVCAPAGAPSSGFVDEDQGGCPISLESWAQIADHRSAPEPWRAVGLVLLVAGVAAGAAALVVGRRGGDGPRRVP